MASFNGLFTAKEQARRASFHRHAMMRRLREYFPRVVSVQSSPLIPGAGRAAFQPGIDAGTSFDPHGQPHFAVRPEGE